MSTQWTRDIRSSVPVRGPTRPSIPPSLPRFEEVYPKPESPKTIYYFLFPNVWTLGYRDGSHNLLRLKAVSLCGCDHAAGKFCEKLARMYVPLTLDSPVCTVLRYHVISFTSNRKRKSLFLVPRYPMDTLSTSVPNDPSFTTHDLLCLL